MDAALLSETSAVHGLFSQAEVDRLLQEHLEGRQDHERILWSLISLEVFLRAFELKNMGRGILLSGNEALAPACDTVSGTSDRP